MRCLICLKAMQACLQASKLQRSGCFLINSFANCSDKAFISSLVEQMAEGVQG
ncbi:uncharacterized protein PHALS_10795 [Plasmopara halstedii]|uniref:Uncharacterized protein n=1 Tax=Plasmopara halstedii TaxID=4781 RepID=A0A0P1AH97_PLAHL|nr:uncharacterized protein PHALS_10795 [Plasmopara halstedii]CEG40609.1 hypothetical protein PHALS_10795 [Plasmopara halstedii]|eukprot:XP_024576978.1 hypothetical protein PHALS_10795 [Plasmopara halstedii]